MKNKLLTALIVMFSLSLSANADVYKGKPMKPNHDIESNEAEEVSFWDILWTVVTNNPLL